MRKLKSDKKGPILCLVGPPGVGKTSLGQSIARARAQVRAHLAGRRARRGRDPRPPAHLRRRAAGPHHPGDEEGRHHNPVFMLDEIDKLGARLPRRSVGGAARGARPRAEPHLLAITTSRCTFDLSKVMFIATANMLDPDPAGAARPHGDPRAPRLHPEEKLQIAQQAPGPEAARGARPGDGADRARRRRADQGHHVVHARGGRAQPRAAHRRRLPRRRGRRGRAARRDEARSLAETTSTSILGPEKFWSEVAERTEVPGVATGLAWTPAGGDMLFIEATTMPGKGSLILTGQLGDVMKESAQAALSYVRSNADGAGHHGELPREAGHPRPLPGGRHPQGRPVGGRHDLHRAGLAAHRASASAATWR